MTCACWPMTDSKRKRMTLYPRFMFTGLIETTGRIVALTATGGATRIVIAAPSLAGRWRTGDSIAVNGVCLTALPVANDQVAFAADLAEETLSRTTLARLTPGSVVNLELPTPAGSPLGGHVVQGHVDATATLVSLHPLNKVEDAADWRLTLEVPSHLAAQITAQGSITVDGISLTVAKLDLSDTRHLRIEIAIIPHTYASTNLHTLTAGAAVNIETDILAKYAAQQAAARQSSAEAVTDANSNGWLTQAYLLANGY